MDICDENESTSSDISGEIEIDDDDDDIILDDAPVRKTIKELCK